MSHLEDSVYCMKCHKTRRMQRPIGKSLWRCPVCRVEHFHSWCDTLQSRGLKAHLVTAAATTASGERS